MYFPDVTLADRVEKPGFPTTEYYSAAVRAINIVAQDGNLSLGKVDPAPPQKEPPSQFSTHFYCGQTAGYIKMPFGMEAASVQATLCSMGTQLAPQKGGGAPDFRPMSLAAKRLHRLRCHLVRR